MKAKNASRSNWIVAGLIGCALVLYGVSNPLGLPHTDVGAEELNYSLPFTSSHNQFTTSSMETTGTAMTTAGNVISFTYNLLTETEGAWETVAPGGYFYNTTPVSGLKTISLVFGDSNGISLSYGWQNRNTGEITYRVTGIALDSATSSYAFLDERPDCFKIENTSGTATVSITSFALTYSCSANSDPYHDSGTAGLGFMLNVDYSSYSVSGYTGSAENVVIPSRYLGKNVTSIGDYAFYGCGSLTSITIPSSVTSIGVYVFVNCVFLTSITIPSGVPSIGDYAFSGCNSLASITIPSSVNTIGSYAFRYCFSLTSIEIPSGVTSIGGYAFANCYNLTINCQATSQPVGWSANWNPSACTVNWGV